MYWWFLHMSTRKGVLQRKNGGLAGWVKWCWQILNGRPILRLSNWLILRSVGSLVMMSLSSASATSFPASFVYRSRKKRQHGNLCFLQKLNIYCIWEFHISRKYVWSRRNTYLSTAALYLGTSLEKWPNKILKTSLQRPCHSINSRQLFITLRWPRPQIYFS